MNEFKEKVEENFQNENRILDSYSSPIDDGQDVRINIRHNDSEILDEKPENVTYDKNQEEKNDKKLRRKDPSNSFKNRVNDLVRQRSEREKEAIFYKSQSDSMYQELEKIRLENEKLKSQITDRELDALTLTEDSLKERLRIAKSEGDIDLEIELIDKLQDVKSDKRAIPIVRHSIELAKNQQNLANLARSDYESVQTEDYYQDNTNYPRNDVLEDWITENEWYTTDYNLRLEANKIATKLADNLSIMGEERLIGTPSFFNQISELIRENYNIDAETPNTREYGDYEHENAKNNQRKSNNYVAGVNRAGNGIVDPYISRERYKTNRVPELTAQEKRMALNTANALNIPIEKAMIMFSDSKKKFNSNNQSYKTKVRIDE